MSEFKLPKITAEGVAVGGLIVIALAALFHPTIDPVTIVIAIASGLIGYIKGTSNGTNT